ncbi:hypothetical protein [Desulfobacula sp.]|uniref:hypothetical protein n=1 Tax=Desulfobacula sp. TaxID=2593537 RepID=UPI00261D7176|nr:hypothetical protein [Desulfobacula sp.]
MAEKKENDQKEEVQELIINPKLPPIWIDLIDPSIRTDGISLIRFATTLPEGTIEQARIITNEDVLKEFVDNICFALDHYPKKPKGKTIKKLSKK